MKASALQDIATAMVAVPAGETGAIHATGEGWVEIRTEYLAAILGVAARSAAVPESSEQGAR